MAKVTKQRRKLPPNDEQKQPEPEGEGIVDLVWVDPKTLNDHPDNWNLHPDRQIDALGASMEANTFFSPILYNLSSNKIVAGHGRKKAAIRKKLTSVPVIRGKWTKDQELRILRDDNILSRMSEADPHALEALNERIARAQQSIQESSQKTRLKLKRLVIDTNEYAQDIIAGSVPAISITPAKDRRVRPTQEERIALEEEEEDEQGEVFKVELNDDALFKSANKFGVPDLRSDFLSDVHPTTTFDRAGVPKDTAWYCISTRPHPPQAERAGGVLGFFTEDFRFRRAYYEAADFAEAIVLSEEWDAIVEPDYSTYGNWPYAVRLYSIYKSRWCCRFWQEMDVNIIPILRKCNDYPADIELMYETLPKQIPVAATDCRVSRLNDPHHWSNFFRSLDLACNIIDIGVIVIYGGSEFKSQLKDELPKGPKYVLLDSYMGARRKIIKGK